MANRTDSQAATVHGTNPQYLVDRIIRSKVYNDAYWKEFCFGVTTESLIDRAVEIDYVGGTYGGRRRPAKFLCLFLKMLQIQPDDDVVLEYIKQADYKYLRALGVAYWRISQKPVQVYNTLEPLFGDYRKLRYRDMTGKMSIIHMDEFIDWLLREETVCDITMPQLPKREILEANEQLQLRQSGLEDDLDDLEDLEKLDESTKDDENNDGAETNPAANPLAEAIGLNNAEPSVRVSTDSPRRSPSRRSSPRAARSVSRRRRGDRDRSPSKSRSRSRRLSRSSRSVRNREDKTNKRDYADAKDKKEKRSKKDKQDKVKKDEDKMEKQPKKDKDGLSVHEWNRVREELGLKPLKK